jgi:hypothetical protein
MRRFSMAMAAALMVAAVFYPCAAQSPKGKSAHGLSFPVFPFKGALREADDSAPVIFPLSGDFRLRSISRASTRAGFGYLGWDYSAKALLLMDEKGKEEKSWPLEAAFAWVNGGLVLARGDAFIDTGEGERGFSYSIFKTDDDQKPRLAWSAAIDCFPADVIFSNDGSIYLAGADRGDKEHAVYRLRPKAKPERLLSAVKRSDFLRLVESGGALLAFPSAREKTARPFEFRYLEKNAAAFKALRTEGMPDDALCAYGYGFAFKGGFVVPVAMADGDIALIRLEAQSGVLRVVNVARGAKGCYLALGPDPDASKYRYLAREASGGSETFYLGRYDGSKATLKKIE